MIISSVCYIETSFHKRNIIKSSINLQVEKDIKVSRNLKWLSKYRYKWIQRKFKKFDCKARYSPTPTAST